MLSNRQEIAAYENDPFDPDAIAKLRIGAYEKSIVMKYIDNLLDWGDNLFAQDSWESIIQATMLYVLAKDLLGKKPKQIGVFKDPAPKTYENIQSAGNNATPKYLVALENRVQPSSDSITLSNKPLNAIDAKDFCVGENEEFIAYWGRVDIACIRSATARTLRALSGNWHCSNRQSIRDSLLQPSPPGEILPASRQVHRPQFHTTASPTPSSRRKASRLHSCNSDLHF